MQEFLNSWKDNKEYFQFLKLMAGLSNLYADSSIPFIHYRVTEKLFCRCFNATNLSRSDIAYDAQYNTLGVGIKTFQLKNGEQSFEKVAEFNKLSSQLRDLKGINLAKRVAYFRNERIVLANTLCNINTNLYHIVGRSANKLTLFNTPYHSIDIDSIVNIRTNKNDSIEFNDGQDEYRFYYSKSVLLKHFKATDDRCEIPINIITDPYELLRNLLEVDINLLNNPVSNEYVVLPLYSTRRIDYVPERSGLNQWNAKGRDRDEDEIYIPIPIKIHQNYPNFFPQKNESFVLHLPNGKTLNAKICQDNGKALMSNPNKDLGKWLLRDIMKITQGKLVTMDKLNELGFNSVIITKLDNINFKIAISNIRDYETFITT